MGKMYVHGMLGFEGDELKTDLGGEVADVVLDSL